MSTIAKRLPGASAAPFEELDSITPGWVMPKLWPRATPSLDRPPLDHACSSCGAPCGSYWQEKGGRRNGWRCSTCLPSPRSDDQIVFADQVEELADA